MPSNQAFTLNKTRLVIQQNGECVSVSPCTKGDYARQAALCVTAEICSNSTLGSMGDTSYQHWGWLNGSTKLELLGLGDAFSRAAICLDVDQHSTLNVDTTGVSAVASDVHDITGCVKLATADDPTRCLGLAAVDGTSEYSTATLVPCSDPSALWRYGSTYLNMTYGSLSNCHVGLSLDSSPR